MPVAIPWILFAGAILALAGCACACVARVRRARVVGPTVFRSRRPWRWRAAFTLLDLALLGLAFRQEPALLAPTLALLIGALGTVWLAPAADERVCGEHGVAIGWEAVRFADLAEWRLIGDHLRFRARDEWRAVDLPHAQHDALRARLMDRCAERESPFSRGAVGG